MEGGSEGACGGCAVHFGDAGALGDGGLGLVFGGLRLRRFGTFERRKEEGAFSGAFGGSLGLLRWRMASRCRRVCQRDLGTRLRVSMSRLNWSVVAMALYGES